MIAVVLLAVVGYAFVYTGMGNLTDGAVTGGNKQGLLTSLGLGKIAPLSQVSGFTTSTSAFREDVQNPAGWDGTTAPATGANSATPVNPPSGGIA